MDVRFQPYWEGPELAMQAVIDRLERIRLELQPVRPDIIDEAAEQALRFMAQLQQWRESLPPGSAYFQQFHKMLPPAGGYPTQQIQMLELPWREGH